MLREDGTCAVDHGIGCAALLAIMHYGVRFKIDEHLCQELEVTDIPHVKLNVLSTQSAPPVEGKKIGVISVITSMAPIVCTACLPTALVAPMY